jgi:glycosyltransferase involved in cell wall biosynthesis
MFWINQPYEHMEISVILPVYNAEAYVSAAIASALIQDEILEVIIVEDGSNDRSSKICSEYAARDERIRLFRHPDCGNHGVSASCNLAIRHAHAPFIAFLGADDLYLPDAFKCAKKIFNKYPDAHGAYAHLGVKYYDTEFKAQHLLREPGEITGLRKNIPPKHLLSTLLEGSTGHISLVSVVLRREILTDDFLFDEALRLGQDTDFLYRLTSVFNLYGPGETSIVALRGVHAKNRVFQHDQVVQYRIQVLQKCIRNRFYGCLDRMAIRAVLRRYLRLDAKRKPVFFPLVVRRQLALIHLLFRNPGLVGIIFKTGSIMNA